MTVSHSAKSACWKIAFFLWYMHILSRKFISGLKPIWLTQCLAEFGQSGERCSQSQLLGLPHWEPVMAQEVGGPVPFLRSLWIFVCLGSRVTSGITESQFSFLRLMAVLFPSPSRKQGSSSYLVLSRIKIWSISSEERTWKLTTTVLEE